VHPSEKSFEMRAFLLTLKDERVHNVHPKFHIIPVIFKLLFGGAHNPR